MAQYTKKPVTVEATQFMSLAKPWPRGVFEDDDTARPYVITIHNQRSYLEIGDWIITEPNGKNHYPCKDGIFQATYQPAGDLYLQEIDSQSWLDKLEERQINEVEFATLYANEFKHGTDGHHRLILIARLAKLLEDLTQENVDLMVDNANLMQQLSEVAT